MDNTYYLADNCKGLIASKAISQYVDNPQDCRGTSCLAMTGTAQKLGFCKVLLASLYFSGVTCLILSQTEVNSIIEP